MDIESELLARYVEHMATARSRTTGAYSRPMDACVALEHVAGQMMDDATPSIRAKISFAYSGVICRVLATCRSEADDS